jgi:hypothetical protein
MEGGPSVRFRVLPYVALMFGAGLVMPGPVASAAPFPPSSLWAAASAGAGIQGAVVELAQSSHALSRCRWETRRVRDVRGRWVKKRVRICRN